MVSRGLYGRHCQTYRHQERVFGPPHLLSVLVQPSQERLARAAVLQGPDVCAALRPSRFLAAVLWVAGCHCLL